MSDLESSSEISRKIEEVKSRERRKKILYAVAIVVVLLIGFYLYSQTDFFLVTNETLETAPSNVSQSPQGNVSTNLPSPPNITSTSNVSKELPELPKTSEKTGEEQPLPTFPSK